MSKLQTTLFKQVHFFALQDYIKDTADRYFAYGQPIDLDPEEMLRLFVPEELHDLAREVPKYYDSIDKGGTILVKMPDGKTKFTVTVSKYVSWAMPKTKGNDDILANTGPAWERIMEWLRWRVEQAHRWDKLYYAIDQINDHLRDPRAAVFYMPGLATLVDNIMLPQAVRHRWNVAKERRDPTEPLQFLIKQLAAESNILITETQLMPKEYPRTGNLKVKLHICDYAPCRVENLNGEKAQLYTWGSNRLY